VRILLEPRKTMSIVYPLHVNSFIEFVAASQGIMLFRVITVGLLLVIEGLELQRFLILIRQIVHRFVEYTLICCFSSISTVVAI